MQIKRRVLMISTLLLSCAFLAQPVYASENTVYDRTNTLDFIDSPLLDEGILIEGSEHYTYFPNKVSRAVFGVYLTSWFQMKAPVLNRRWHVSYINGGKYQGWLYATGNKKLVTMNGDGTLFYSYEFSGLLEKK